jgi:hypothetical protein
VEVQVRWEKGVTEQTEDYTFFCGEENEDHQLGTVFLYIRKIISAVRRVEFVTDRISYIILRGCWCSIIILNVHTPSEDKNDDIRGSFCEELGHIHD